MEQLDSKEQLQCRFFRVFVRNLLHQMYESPTRLRNYQEPSILDLVLVNDNNNKGSIEYLDPVGASDNCVLKFENMCYFKYTKNAIEKLNYYKADFDALRQELDIDWNAELDDKNTCEMLNAFMDKFNQAVNKHVPKRKQKSTNNTMSVSKETLQSIRREPRLGERYMESKVKKATGNTVKRGIKGKHDEKGEKREGTGSGRACTWIKTFLNNRQQCVQVKGQNHIGPKSVTKGIS